MTENTNKQIGDYEIIRELGHGGMGKVYQVRNILSDRVEAMKVVLPDLAGRSEFVSRFMREIKVLASLDHPNIAALRTAFTADNQFVMIMEYVEGVTLADRLEQGRFSTPEALNCIDQVLAALSYAHGKHIIHRDIKPGNMMLTPQGVVKLMDFGLARSGDELGLTVTGATLGSLDYISPEQVNAQLTDERSDLYSVGVSLYQMVTRQRMFGATSAYSIMEAHVKETPRPPIEVQPSVPKPVSDLIMMAVAKDPARRFQTADAFRNALQQVARSSAMSPESEAAAAAMTMQVSQAGSSTPTSQGTPVRQSESHARGEDQAVSAAAAAVQPAPATGQRGLLWAIVAIVLVAALGGAAFYKSRQGGEGNKTANLSSVQGNSAPAAVPSAAGNAANPGSNISSPPPQMSTPAPAAVPAAQPEAKDTAPRKAGAELARNRAVPGNGAPALGPGGSAADAPPPQPPPVDPKVLLDEMERESDQLDSRAAAVESSLDTLEQQMHRDGLGLRGDIVASRSNMRTDLSKAKQALDNADADRARRYLDLAHHEVERLEAFLGRR